MEHHSLNVGNDLIKITKEREQNTTGWVAGV